MIKKTAMKMIKCTHHHFLKWAPSRAPKLFFVGVGVTLTSSTTEDFVADILYSYNMDYELEMASREELQREEAGAGNSEK